MSQGFKKGLIVVVVLMLSAFSGARSSAQQPNPGDPSVIDDTAVPAPIENGDTVMKPMSTDAVDGQDTAIPAPTDEMTVTDTTNAFVVPDVAPVATTDEYFRGWFEACIEYAPVQKCADRVKELKTADQPEPSAWWRALK